MKTRLGRCRGRLGGSVHEWLLAGVRTLKGEKRADGRPRNSADLELPPWLLGGGRLCQLSSLNSTTISLSIPDQLSFSLLLLPNQLLSLQTFTQSTSSTPQRAPHEPPARPFSYTHSAANISDDDLGQHLLTLRLTTTGGIFPGCDTFVTSSESPHPKATQQTNLSASHP